MSFFKSEHVVVVGLAVLAMLLINTVARRNIPVIGGIARTVQTGL